MIFFSRKSSESFPRPWAWFGRVRAAFPGGRRRVSGAALSVRSSRSSRPPGVREPVAYAAGVLVPSRWEVERVGSPVAEAAAFTDAASKVPTAAARSRACVLQEDLLSGRADRDGGADDLPLRVHIVPVRDESAIVVEAIVRDGMEVSPALGVRAKRVNVYHRALRGLEPARRRFPPASSSSHDGRSLLEAQLALRPLMVAETCSRSAPGRGLKRS